MGRSTIYNKQEIKDRVLACLYEFSHPLCRKDIYKYIYKPSDYFSYPSLNDWMNQLYKDGMVQYFTVRRNAKYKAEEKQWELTHKGYRYIAKKMKNDL